jgi:hypothetical protein
VTGVDSTPTAAQAANPPSLPFQSAVINPHCFPVLLLLSSLQLSILTGVELRGTTHGAPHGSDLVSKRHSIGDDHDC